MDKFGMQFASGPASHSSNQVAMRSSFSWVEHSLVCRMIWKQNTFDKAENAQRQLRGGNSKRQFVLILSVSLSLLVSIYFPTKFFPGRTFEVRVTRSAYFRTVFVVGLLAQLRVKLSMPTYATRGSTPASTKLISTIQSSSTSFRMPAKVRAGSLVMTKPHAAQPLVAQYQSVFLADWRRALVETAVLMTGAPA